jgi:Ion channel
MGAVTGRRSRYPRMLTTIVLAYGVIIALNDSAAGGVVRLLLLGYLLWEASRLRNRGWTWPRRIVWIGAALALATVVILGALTPARVTSGLVGGASAVLTALVIVIVGRAVIERNARAGVDTPMVLGVLSVYLLLALLFASLNQFAGAFDEEGYLAGVAGMPTASDQLYFSVITLATVGYGDITPASEVARAVAVVEALTGQIYLVSVVAAVVGGWHRKS